MRLSFLLSFFTFFKKRYGFIPPYTIQYGQKKVKHRRIMPMLYPHSKDPSLTPELFKNPGSEYRGTPFWAWNCELKKDELLRQLRS